MVQKDPSKAPIPKPVQTVIVTPTKNIKKTKQMQLSAGSSGNKSDAKSHSSSGNSNKSSNTVSNNTPPRSVSPRWPRIKASSKQIRTTLNSLVGVVVAKSAQQ